MTEKNKSLFQELNSIDISKHVEKKGNGNFKLSYLSWVWAWSKMKEIDPEAKRQFTKFDEYDRKTGQLTGRKVDYMLTPEGCYVECTVTIKNHSETEQLFVMDFHNKAVLDPDMGQINKTKQRCFVKALALHGLGLYIYAGEDLPNPDTDEVSKSKKASDPTNVAKKDGPNTEEVKPISNIEKGQITRGISALSGLTSIPEDEIEKSVKEKFKFTDLNSINQNQARVIIKYIADAVNDNKK